MRDNKLFAYSKGDFEKLGIGQAIQNIVSVYDVVPGDEKDKSLFWYPEAFKTCQRIAQEYGLTTAQVAGIVAVVSPNLRWDKNVLMAIKVIRHYNVFGEFFLQGSGFMCYPANTYKAMRILSGETPENVISGRKVTSFYRNIMQCNASVTVDRHALNVLYNGTNGGKSGKLVVSAHAYDLHAMAYRFAAQYVSERDNVTLSAEAIQAITWTFYAAKGN